MTSPRRHAALRGLLAVSLLAQSVAPAAAGWNPFSPTKKHRRDDGVTLVAETIDDIEKHLEYFGTISAKQPDVWGEARLTKYRRDVETQLENRIGRFDVTINAALTRRDATFAAAAFSLGVGASGGNGSGLGGDGGDGATVLMPPAAQPSQSAIANGNLSAAFTNALNQNQIGSNNTVTGPTINATGGTATAGAADGGGGGGGGGGNAAQGLINPQLFTGTNGLGSAAIAPPANFGTGLAVDPITEVNQLYAYLKNLNQLRRTNEGDDTADAPGYSLHLVRIPVSVLPGDKTREGHGAEITITAEPRLSDELLPSMMRDLVINDVVEMLALPVLKFSERDDDLRAAGEPTIAGTIRAANSDPIAKHYLNSDLAEIRAIQQQIDLAVPDLITSRFADSLETCECIDPKPCQSNTPRDTVRGLIRQIDYKRLRDALGRLQQFSQSGESFEADAYVDEMGSQDSIALYATYRARESVRRYLQVIRIDIYERATVLGRTLEAIKARRAAGTLGELGKLLSKPSVIESLESDFGVESNFKAVVEASSAVEVLDLYLRIVEGIATVKPVVLTSPSKAVEIQTESLQAGINAGIALMAKEDVDPSGIAVVVSQQLRTSLEAAINAIYRTWRVVGDVESELTALSSAYSDAAEVGGSLSSSFVSTRNAEFAIKPTAVVDALGGSGIEKLAEKFSGHVSSRRAARNGDLTKLGDSRTFLRAEAIEAYEELCHYPVPAITKPVTTTVKKNVWGESEGEKIIVRKFEERTVDRPVVFVDPFDGTEEPIHPIADGALFWDIFPPLIEKLVNAGKVVSSVALLQNGKIDNLEELRYTFFRAYNEVTNNGNGRRAATTNAALAWAILVESALLSHHLGEHITKHAEEKGCCSAHAEGLRFYGPEPDPTANEVFKDFMRCKFPVRVFAIDPVTNEQNVDDQFSLRRELQLAAAMALSNGGISADAFGQFARRIELDARTISQNRTVVGFSHGEDTFGWRFYPRFQTPELEGNVEAFVNTVFIGGPSRDRLLKQRRLEPGQRECVAIMVAPSFVPYVDFDMRSNWFKLTDPDTKRLDLTDSVTVGYRLQRARDLATKCLGSGRCYRPDDLNMLVRTLDQIERRLPLQSAKVPMPTETSVGGFELFQTGQKALAPKLVGYYGAPGLTPGQDTAVFLVGDNFSVHETRVVVGNRAVVVGGPQGPAGQSATVRQVENINETESGSTSTTDSTATLNVTFPTATLLSRQVIELIIPGSAVPAGDDVLDLHVATPYGVSNHLEISVANAASAANVVTGRPLAASEAPTLKCFHGATGYTPGDQSTTLFLTGENFVSTGMRVIAGGRPIAVDGEAAELLNGGLIRVTIPGTVAVDGDELSVVVATPSGVSNTLKVPVVADESASTDLKLETSSVEGKFTYDAAGRATAVGLSLSEEGVSISGGPEDEAVTVTLTAVAIGPDFEPTDLEPAETDAGAGQLSFTIDAEKKTVAITGATSDKDGEFKLSRAALEAAVGRFLAGNDPPVGCRDLGLVLTLTARFDSEDDDRVVDPQLKIPAINCREAAAVDPAAGDLKPVALDEPRSLPAPSRPITAISPVHYERTAGPAVMAPASACHPIAR